MLEWHLNTVDAIGTNIITKSSRHSKFDYHDTVGVGTETIGHIQDGIANSGTVTTRIKRAQNTEHRLQMVSVLTLTKVNTNNVNPMGPNYKIFGPKG